jgi:hypothetical protein
MKTRFWSGAVLFTGAFFVQAQYAVEWYTIDSGGGTSEGGPYRLSGTMGQPDAGTLSGGVYTLQGGFWPGLVASSASDVPTLFIQLVPQGVTVSWAPAIPGFILEQTDRLDAGTWAPSGSGNPATFPAGDQATFYRLKKP